MNQSYENQAFPYQQTVGQVPPGQFQPVFVHGQAPFGQYAQQPAQPAAAPTVFAHAQAPPGQYAQQPVGQVGQLQVQAVQPAVAAPTVPKTTAYWQSALIAERVVEFLFLSAAWISIVRYSSGSGVGYGGSVNFFKGITVFCWIVSIVFQIGFVIGFNHIKRLFSQPSLLTIICFIVHIILTILLVACTVNLVFYAHAVSTTYEFQPLLIRTNLNELYLALIFGFLACFSFFETVRLFFKMIVTQRGEEATDNTAQTAPQLATQLSAIQPKNEI